MEKFAIVTDFFCELNKRIRDEYEIDFFPGHLLFPDGTEKNLNLEWDIMTKDSFYAAIKKNPDIYKTSPANVTEITQKFESYVKEGIGVLCVTISTAISGTYNFAMQAKKAVEEKYPEAKIIVIDSLRYGPAFGLMCVKASIMRKEGKSLQEVGDYLTTNKACFRQSGWIDDLSFVAKKGRITNSKAFFGKLIGIKPFGELSSGGLPTIIGNIKGEKLAFKVILDYMAETIENPQDQVILLCDSLREKQLATYKQMIEERLHPKAIIQTELFCGCGINMGPGLMSAYFIGKPITEDLNWERELFQKLIEKNK